MFNLGPTTPPVRHNGYMANQTVSVMFEPFLSDTIDPTTGCVSAAGQRLNKWVPAARPNRFNVPNCVGVY